MVSSRALPRVASGTQSIVFMFSGQGSQYYQMGRSLFAANTAFRRWMLRLDDVARELNGSSILNVLYGNRSKTEPFDQLRLTHPAIFMVEYSLAQALIENGVRPDMTIGASLGAFAAASVAGMLAPEVALEAVIGHARIIEQECQRGGMLAILASPALWQEAFLREKSEIAAINLDSHFIVAAEERACRDIEAELKRRGITHQAIPVTFAFHSRWIEAAARSLRSLGSRLPTAGARLPMICCESARIVERLDADYFWNVARGPIRFREAVAALEREGTYRYIDVGPSGTLGTFLKYSLPSGSTSKAHIIMSPLGGDTKNFEALAH